MIVDDLNFVDIARAKKSDAKLIVYPNAPLAITIPFKFL